MQIPVPNPQAPAVRVEVINEKGEQYTVSSGGGMVVEVEDDVVEAILTSSDNVGNRWQHAWSKAQGVETLQTFLDNKKLREKVAEFERKQKQQARNRPEEKEDEEVQASADVPRKPSKD